MEAGGDPQGHTGHTPKDNRGHMLHPCFRKLRSRKPGGKAKKKKKFPASPTQENAPPPSPFPNSTSDAWELRETFLGCLVLRGTGPLLRWYFGGGRCKPFCPEVLISNPSQRLHWTRRGGRRLPKPQRTAVGPLPASWPPQMVAEGSVWRGSQAARAERRLIKQACWQAESNCSRNGPDGSRPR